MATKKAAAEKPDKKKSATGKQAPVEQKQQGSIQIMKAVVKDDFCNYEFEVTEGVGQGDTHSVKGKGIVDDDLKKSLGKMNVHLACVDDVFKHANVEFDNIDTVRSHELAGLYQVTGLKFKGGEEDLSVILFGNKYVSQAGGRIELETPRIPLDNLSSYPWHKKLLAVALAARKEVELYRAGKCTPVEPKEIKNENQLTIGDELDIDEEGAEAGEGLKEAKKFVKNLAKKGIKVTVENKSGTFEEPGVDFESGKVK